MGKLSEQLIAEIKRQADDIDQLQYGEVILKVQDGVVIRGEILKSWRAGPKNGRSER